MQYTTYLCQSRFRHLKSFSCVNADRQTVDGHTHIKKMLTAVHTMPTSHCSMNLRLLLLIIEMAYLKSATDVAP